MQFGVHAGILLVLVTSSDQHKINNKVELLTVVCRTINSDRLGRLWQPCVLYVVCPVSTSCGCLYGQNIGCCRMAHLFPVPSLSLANSPVCHQPIKPPSSSTWFFRTLIAGPWVNLLRCTVLASGLVN